MKRKGISLAIAALLVVAGLFLVLRPSGEEEVFAVTGPDGTEAVLQNLSYDEKVLTGEIALAFPVEEGVTPVERGAETMKEGFAPTAHYGETERGIHVVRCSELIQEDRHSGTMEFEFRIWEGEYDPEEIIEISLSGFEAPFRFYLREVSRPEESSAPAS